MKIRVELSKRYISYTLAEDVFKEREIKLIGKGKVLNESLYQSLKKHGIRHIYVYDNLKGI